MRRKYVLGSVALLIAVGLVVQPYRVSGDSMEPALHDGDWVWTLPLWSAPRRGQLVVFQAPDGSGRSIKRIAGLPGEAQSQRHLRLKPADNRPFIETTRKEWGLAEAGQQALPEGQYYLVGDHASSSIDSRQFGPVDVDQIRRRIIWRPRSASGGARAVVDSQPSGEQDG